jgi:hypothetical protein
MNRETNMMKVIVFVYNFANTPKNGLLLKEGVVNQNFILQKN